MIEPTTAPFDERQAAPRGSKSVWDTFSGMITETLLSGTLADQSALHGILDKVRDLSLCIVTVRRLPLSRRVESLDERIRRGVGREMTMALVSAPSNLGLRPPQPTSVPGCAKAPEALREAGLFQRMAEFGAVDAGVVLPGRYADDAAQGRLRNQGLIVEHARRLAERIGALRQLVRSRW